VIVVLLIVFDYTCCLPSVDTAIRKVQSQLRHHTLRYITPSESRAGRNQFGTNQSVVSSVPNTARNAGSLVSKSMPSFSWSKLHSHSQQVYSPGHSGRDPTASGGSSTFLTANGGDVADDVSEDLTNNEFDDNLDEGHADEEYAGENEDADYLSAMEKVRAGTGGDYENISIPVYGTSQPTPDKNRTPIITKTLSAAKLLRLQNRYSNIYTCVKDVEAASTGIAGQTLIPKYYPVHDKVMFMLAPNTLPLAVASATMKSRMLASHGGQDGDNVTSNVNSEIVSRLNVSAPNPHLSDEKVDDNRLQIVIDNLQSDSSVLVVNEESPLVSSSGFANIMSTIELGSQLASSSTDPMGIMDISSKDVRSRGLTASPNPAAVAVAASPVIAVEGNHSRPASSRIAMKPTTAALYFSPAAKDQANNNAGASHSNVGMGRVQTHISVSLKQPASLARMHSPTSRTSRPSTCSAALSFGDSKEESSYDGFGLSNLNTARDSIHASDRLQYGLSTMSKVSEGNEIHQTSLAQPSQGTLEFSLGNDTTGKNAKAIEKIMSKLTYSSPPDEQKLLFGNNFDGGPNSGHGGPGDESCSMNDNDSSLVSVDSASFNGGNAYAGGANASSSGSVVIRDPGAPIMAERRLKEIK
jgi:hypothetical protein